MSMERDYIADLPAVAAERLARGEIDRRTFWRALAAAGLAPVLGGVPGREALAAPGELVLCNFGGVAAKEYRNAFGPGFEKATGLKLVVDGAGASSAKIRAMVQANATSWDVCDFGPSYSLAMGREGVLEPIDYSIVDKSQILPGFALEYGCAAYTFTFGLAFIRSALPAVPTGWKDFWDLKRFPGKRTLYKTPAGQMEAALLAAGVEPDKLYPLDVDLACAKLKEIKSEVLFWDSGAQSQQYFRDGEVTMGNIWNTRATLLKGESNGDTDFTFNQGILWVGGWMIPKNNPAGAVNANRFIRSAQDPAEQVQLFKTMFNGAANPRAADLMPADLQAANPTSPANLRLQVQADATWWGENFDRAQDRWLDAIS